MPKSFTATSVGIPRDAGCLWGWRDFLNFLKNDILMETGKNQASKALKQVRAALNFFLKGARSLTIRRRNHHYA
jgi:hypothetical protein